MPSQSTVLAKERIERQREADERAQRADNARRAALENPKRQAAITLYQQERERAERQGKRVLRSIDDYRRTVPDWVVVEYGGAR
jgi:hypothetical protein